MPSPAPRDTRFRDDITGLRTIAILAVVLVHAGVTWLPGGFVGVDVFFVISGFLITAHLLREAEATGRIDLIAFWARRLRRLFPALVAATVATCVIAALIFSPLELRGLAFEGGATVLSVANILFAQQATDDFGHDVQQSPLLHMWSLGAEEQFHLALPIVVLIVAFAARRLRMKLRTVLAVALVAVFVVSLAASVYVTDNHPFWAFYTLPTRAWEFTVGGLVALALGSRTMPKSWGSLSVWIGLGLIASSCLFIQASDAFPGLIAAVPVVGSALIIAGGSAEAPPSKLIGSAPMKWIGERSYSWYLCTGRPSSLLPPRSTRSLCGSVSPQPGHHWGSRTTRTTGSSPQSVNHLGSREAQAPYTSP